MLISMAQERLGSDKLAREHRATAAGSRNAAAAEEEVYRGGGRYGIYLSVDLVFVTIASSALEAGRAFRNAYVPLSEQDLVYMRNALPAMDKETSRQQLPQRSATETQPLSVESTVNVTGDNDTEDLDEENVVDPAIYCYPFFPGWGVHLTERARAAQTESKVLSQTLQLRSAKNGDTLIETYIPYFGDDFIPPPPPTEFVAGPAQGSCSSSSSNSRNPSTSSPSAGKDAAPTGVPAVEPSTSTFTPQQIEALLPTYFVPMDAFLAQLPAGYTADHVRAVFSETKAVETVQLGGNTFIRFHGGRDGEGFSKTMLHDQQRRLDFVEPYDAATASSALEKHRPSSSTRGEEEEAQLRRGIAAFKPDPFLLYAFLPLFTRPFQWLPLYDVVQHAPAAVQNKLLPLRAQLTLLYFAQQQQRVQFTPQNGGGVALCGPPTRSLRPETTPLPRVLAELCVLISNRGVVYVEELENDAGQLLSDYAKRHIIAYFGTLRRFLFQHEASFRLSVFTSPTTLYEAGAATGEKEAGTGSEQRALGAQGPASLPTSSPAQTSPSPAAAATADNTPRDGKEANDRHHTTETALPPRPGAGFITNAPPQFLHFSASNFPPHEGGSSDAAASPSDSAADALRQGVVHTPNISRDEAQLDVEGFPRWLASRDLAVQLEKEAKLHDRHMESLTEQLEVVERSNSRKGRKLRRRLAAIVNPNSPFSDPAVLLDAILRYLPPTRHVSLKALLAALPTSMSDFLPNDPVRLFRNSPDKVQLFEYRRKNHLRVMRPGLPLPDGRLRASYTEEELLHLIAAQLPPGQGMYSNALYGNLPYGAREAIRLRHHHLVTLVERYPQYFVVVFSDAAKEAKHRARVSLLRPPPAPRDWSANDVAFESALTAEELESVEKADRAVLLAELPPELLRDTPASRSAAQGREPESEEQN
ncbi:putative mitochondrial hypothetical protein [Leptomonas pyrrhocoris]|uniref:Uncharacterized protein n=1 Tax=Leptomonas pyrrhocoris TaxID=157538 RepID=A0A0M9FWE7_LEPPY|nr:putative mitochondrial hypothetical protein [Leptomonas pyrrhocoris]KPA77276.1 putative mitochondrial hypothetical protein [Leptomonas pyrrhocoris]|eukprot:XP_015655715.1 putative mitochondrial hypothetical protein [Leptomonas pyrrhocoris]